MDAILNPHTVSFNHYVTFVVFYLKVLAVLKETVSTENPDDSSDPEFKVKVGPFFSLGSYRSV